MARGERPLPEKVISPSLRWGIYPSQYSMYCCSGRNDFFRKMVLFFMQQMVHKDAEQIPRQFLSC